MAQNSNSPPNTDLPVCHWNEIKKLLWGSNVKDEVFCRWAQGFQFSKDEPTALVQREGGPCAILAPVQGYVLKILLSEPVGNNWREVDQISCQKLLVEALCDILKQASSGQYLVVTVGEAKEKQCPSIQPTRQQQTSADIIEMDASTQNLQLEQFHEQLGLKTLQNLEDVVSLLEERIEDFQDTFGVLLFLYSVLLTKGVEHVRREMSDPSEPLIDCTHGHGSQSLINLMLTGRAVGHVWDHDKNVDGLKLLGISEQSEVGFLTLLEHLRYCEVGWFLKNPKHPVWVLGSETHLTVLFSTDRRLVSPETPSEVAIRVFKSYDPEGNNFISAVLLQDVLHALDLVSEPEYVDIMRHKLDSENLGIILLGAFMDEFFPDEKHSVPDTFPLFHYNGQPRSCPDLRVVYQEGNAVILESNVRSVSENNPMLTCLQTKWPNIEVQWLLSTTPSLN